MSVVLNISRYWPDMPPIYQKKNSDTKKKRIDYMNIMKEELSKIC